VTVSSLDGGQCRQDIDCSSMISALQQLAITKLDVPLSLETSKLILISGRTLDGAKTLQEESIKDKDEFILIRRRQKQPSDRLVDGLDNPLPEVPDSVIDEVCAGLHEPTDKTGVTERPPEHGGTAHIWLTRIIVTLVDCAEMLQYDRLDSLAAAEPDEHDVSQIKQIMDCGFTVEQAKAALAANFADLSTAIEWLLAGNGNDEAVAQGPRRRRRKGAFEPDAQAVKNLVEMGFEEGAVRKALGATRNNQQDACNYLLGDQSEPPSLSPEAYMPLERDHPLYKMVMERSEIQKALLTPKFLDAMKDLGEKRATIVDFSDDPDVGPILFQISKAIQKFSSQV